jgi:nucleotide-binding universal stress UspA family protein
MRVLLATDGSEPAIRACDHASTLLVPGRDQVRLLTVLSYSEYPYSLVPDDIPLGDEAERVRRVVEDVHRLTDQSRKLLESSGHTVEIAHRFGNPTDEIVAEIEDWLPELVVLGRRGVRGVARWMGSVSEHVLHHADVPVLLVP